MRIKNQLAKRQTIKARAICNFWSYRSYLIFMHISYATCIFSFNDIPCYRFKEPLWP